MVSTLAVCTSNPLLQKGSQGKNVIDLQKMLNSKVGNSQQIGTDGIFGAATEKLAKMMQYRLSEAASWSFYSQRKVFK